MPLVGLYVGKEKTYLFSDNCKYLKVTKILRDSPRQFHIQKFKNFVVGYNGEDQTFSAFQRRFDFDSFPERLTKSWLMRNFYLDFLDFLANDMSSEVQDGVLTKADFGIVIMGKDYAFDIGCDYLYEAVDFNVLGDCEIAFHIEKMFRDKYDDEELLKLIMEKSDKYGYRTSYPFIMVTNDDLNHYVVINEDGSQETHELKQIWRK